MEKSPVMLRRTHEADKKRWSRWLLFTNLFWVVISVFLYQGWIATNKSDPQIFSLKEQVKDYKVRDEIFNVLRSRGVSLSQGIDIANSLMVHSKKNGIPLELGLAIMKKESGFAVNAISDAKAMGLMQLMPQTFDDYNKNLKLGLSRSAVYDPIINIMISMLHLKDLIEENKGKAKTDDELWKRVLTAYSGGARDYPQTVRRFQREYENKFREGET